MILTKSFKIIFFLFLITIIIFSPAKSIIKDLKNGHGLGSFLYVKNNFLNNFFIKNGLTISNYGKIFKIEIFDTFEIDNSTKKPFGYLESTDKGLYFITGNGELYFYPKKGINYGNKKILKTNLNKYFEQIDIYKSSFSNNPIRDIMINESNIFLSINNNLVDKDGMVNAYPLVLKGKIGENTSEIFFKIIYEFNQLTYLDEDQHVGGKIKYFKNNNFLFAVPDYGDLDNIYNSNTVNGKILILKDIDFKSNLFNIFSIGHRNPQGLYYDDENDLIISTEHGPLGGDEINLIKFQKSYGWPYSSYGTDLHEPKKSHKKYGYEEPIHFFEYNPGISEIVKLDEEFIDSYPLCFAVASLTGYSFKFGHHLYFLCGKSKDSLEIVDKIYIGDRIRDITYSHDFKKIFLVLENKSQIITLSKF